jgi:hypothetical protein
VVPTGKKPAAIFRINKESLSRTDVVVSWDGKDLWWAVTGGGLGRPHTHLPAVIKDKGGGTAILKDGVVIFILVELDTAVEAGAVFRVAVVSLPGTFKHCLWVLPDFNRSSVFGTVIYIFWWNMP